MKPLILDCQADFVQGDFITSRPVPNTWYKVVLAGLCRKHGNATILVICHPSKASMADGSFSEGNTANRTAVRRKIVMELASKRLPDGPRALRLNKNNYGPRGRPTRLVWRNGIFVLDSDPDLTEETVTMYGVIVAKIQSMIRAGLIVVKAPQATGHSPEGVARALGEDTADGDGVMPSPADVKAAMEWGERKGLLRYIAAKAGTRTKAHYEIGDPNAAPDVGDTFKDE